MLDPIQILISVGGVSLVVLLVWLATRSAPPVVLGGEAGARAWLARELPGFTPGPLAVDIHDRRGLAVSNDAAEVALIFVIGRRTVGWRLPAAKLGRPEVRDTQGATVVAVSTGDFTRPSFWLEVADASPIRGLLSAATERGGLG
jgi:hypothetical protein